MIRPGYPWELPLIPTVTIDRVPRIYTRTGDDGTTGLL
jgi:hypothetical protein